jgi:mono/diheme cytochrome c family protein
MTHTRLLLSVIATTLVLAAFAIKAEETGQSNLDGRELYMVYQCWQCHGYEGQGGAAARISGKTYSLEAFAIFVRQPNLMPVYTRELLNDAELRRIYEYVRSIPVPPALEDIPALRDD